MLTLGVQCWFCGEGIDETDREAVEVSVRNLWKDEDDDRRQCFYLHSICAVDRLQGATMMFSLDVFSDPN
ncbi:hypothetical protein BSQ44_18925 [Aquibium oceanicum]|uniref:Uncharacterized protein n=1 Tax=Aquibium oceanicum TaxID=1670800 RepID=A0A1L3SV62_9HYPH|nr:hypothetical protein BSQ44_18925 [Aquibium oceanicum]